MVEIVYNVLIVNIVCTLLFLALSQIQKNWHLIKAKYHGLLMKYLLLFFTVPVFLVSYHSLRAITQYTKMLVESPQTPDIYGILIHPMRTIAFPTNDIWLIVSWILFVVWVTGAVIALVKLRNKTKELKELSEDFFESDRLNQLLEEVKINQGVRKEIQVYMTDLIISPCLTALKHPIILFPVDYELHSDQELVWQLAHEINHIKHHDLFFLKIMNMVRAIYWFNPFIKSLEDSFELSIELSSDEDVIESLTREEVFSYAELLVYYASKEYLVNKMVYLNFAQTKKSILLERIKHMKKNNGTKLKVAFSVLMTCLFVLATPLSVYASSEVVNEIQSNAIVSHNVYYMEELEPNEVIEVDLDPEMATVEYLPPRIMPFGNNSFGLTIPKQSRALIMTYNFTESAYIFLSSSSSLTFSVSLCPAGSLVACKTVVSNGTYAIQHTMYVTGSYDVWIVNANNSSNYVSGSLNVK